MRLMNARRGFLHETTLRAKGFTLPELVTVVAIVGIIAALAAPAFNNLIRSQRIKTATNNLASALIFARSEAVKRNTDVTITRVGTGNAWGGGWTISYVDGGTQTPRSQAALNQLKVTGNVPSVTFGGGGRADSTANFTIDSDPTISNVEARCVEVGLNGMPRMWTARGGDHNCAND